MNLAHLLQRQALLDPQRPAIFEGTALTATHGQWAERAARLGARLQAQGLRPGDRVLLFMRNHPRYLELMFGAWWAGLVVALMVVMGRSLRRVKARPVSIALHSAFGTQILLGIATVMTGIALWLAALHQLTGALLLAITVWAAHRLGRKA